MTTNESLSRKPHIVLIVARGEAVRNFLYSDTLAILSREARVTLLSAIHDEKFIQRFGPLVERIIPLPELKERWIVKFLREMIDMAHYRWIWTEKVKNKWELLDYEAHTPKQKLRVKLFKAFARLFASRAGLNFLAFWEYHLSILLNPTPFFKLTFSELKPDLVFNCSHIHAPRGEMPARIAHKMGITTATFVFSWDNLSSRGRILPPYDHFLVWHEGMRDELLHLYHFIKPMQVHITGTPQFDYHFKPEYQMTRQQLAEHIGFDPNRPFVLYTTGMDRDFPGEVGHVHTVIEILKEIEISKRPQLVVRTYVKGNSPEMEVLAHTNTPDVFFPPVLWDTNWFMPQEEDLAIYSSLLKQCLFGINPASTVSLELMMYGKPVMNLGFDPPGTNLPGPLHWQRHIGFDHYQWVVAGGGVRVAYSVEEMRAIIQEYVHRGNCLREEQQRFLDGFFGPTLDGNSGKRVANTLINLMEHK